MVAPFRLGVIDEAVSPLCENPLVLYVEVAGGSPFNPQICPTYFSSSMLPWKIFFLTSQNTLPVSMLSDPA